MRKKIIIGMLALMLLLLPAALYLQISRSFRLSVANAREGALHEEAVIAQAVAAEIRQGQRESDEALRQAAQKVQEIFTTDVMRVYTNDDVYGVELCGALKNVMALAAGMSGGLGYGDNARAALITRGITELARLGRAMGCEPSTFYGLTGMGDLIVTATSEHSRNNRCGYLIGSGVAPGEAVKQIGMVVEGINALEAAVELADKYGVEMPIVNAVDSILKGKLPPREAVNGLMNRRRRSETEG